MLSHIENSKAGRDLHEPVTGNLFKCTLIPPSTVSGAEILTEAIRSLTGWKNPGPEAIQQQFQTSRRNYASSDVDDTQVLTGTFELNLDEQNSFYVYNIMKAWKNTVRNPLTGEEGLKKDYVGKIIVENHNRAGDIFWTRTLHNAFITGNFEGLDPDYGSPDPQQLAVTLTADYYTESVV